MKILIAVPFLSSCSLLDPLAPIEGVPGGASAADVITQAAPDIAVQVATGNYVGAAIGAGSVILTLLGVRGYKRVKASGPGTMGLFAPPPGGEGK